MTPLRAALERIGEEWPERPELLGSGLCAVPSVQHDFEQYALALESLVARLAGEIERLRATPKRLGPNHTEACNGNDWRYSGDGYNRVRLCKCGAEDHAPDYGKRGPQ